MAEPAFQQDLPFGLLVVRLGLASAEAVQEAIAEQARRHAAGDPIRLGRVLIQQGVLTPEQAWKVLEAQGKKIMGCPECRVFYNVEDLGSGKQPPCPACGAELERTVDLQTVKQNLDVAGTVRLRGKRSPPRA